MKFAICNETFQNQPFRSVCECAGRLGYDGVELAPFTLGKLVTELSAAERRELRAAASDNGVEIIGLHWLLVLPKGIDKKLHINCADAAVRQQTAEYYKELIHLCAELGGKIMVHGSPAQRNWDVSEKYQETFARTVEFFQSTLDAAKECGVTICFEPLTHAETNFINRARDARDLIEAAGHSSLKLHLDAKAMCGGEFDSPAETIRKNKDILRHFHANDRNKKGPGTGDVDFKPIAAAMKEIGYQGYVSVEVFDYAPDGETIARESLKYLKEVFV